MIKAKKDKFTKIFVQNLLIAVLLAVFTFAKIDTRISPFLFAFLFAAIYTRANKIFIGAAAFLLSLFTAAGRGDILSNGLQTAIFFVLAWVLPNLRQRFSSSKKWNKFKLEYVILVFAYVISNALHIVLACGNLVSLYMSLVNLLMGIIFLIVSLITVNAVQTRFNKIPWTPDQKICAGVMIIILSLGLGYFDNAYFSFHKFAAIFIILCAAMMFDGKTALVVGICIGLGRALETLDLTFIAIYSLFSLAAAAFKSRDKYLSVIAVMLTDLVLGFYFRAYFGYGLFEILPTVAACVCALILPRALQKHFDFSRSVLGGYLVSKNTINKNREGTYKRLNNLADVFNEMQNIYRDLVQGSISQEDNARMLARLIAQNMCEKCENRPNCYRDVPSSESIDIGFEKLCLVGLSKGSVSFLDLPPDMSFKCTKLNSVLNLTNTLVSRVQDQKEIRTGQDAGKVIMAGLLSGLSKLCKNFAADLGAEVVFDIEKGTKIKDTLLRAGIVASDCLITKNSTGEYSVSILVTRADSQNTAIGNIVSGVVGHKLQVDSIDNAETAGFSIVTVKTAPRYSLTFGIAQVSKDMNPQNGDTFSFLKINTETTMMALCDGMGTGESAHRSSILAISLVENFYKAGFPNELIMESVNQLLIITKQETFSAIDIAVFSLSDGQVNFIKVGGVESFIKRSLDVEVVEAGSLPIGIVEEMIPKITRAHLSEGDMVVVCSDGITDSFADRTALAGFINNIQNVTPQKLADEIVAEALRRTDKLAIDDCTVMVAQLSDLQ